jgi:hypothetical protein
MLFSCSVLVELSPPPTKSSGCDLKQWIDDYMTPSDESYVEWLKKTDAMRRGASCNK